MKRPVKIVAILLVVAAVAAGAVAGALAVLFPPQKVKELVLEKAGHVLHREVKLQSASLRFFPFLGVSLEGFEVANNPDSGFAADPLVSLKSLDVKLSTMSLLRMAPVVDGIVLQEPRIRVEILADGRTSLDGLGGDRTPKKAPSKSDSVKALRLPFPLSVRKVAIEDGSVAWLDRRDGREVVLGDIDQEVSLQTDAALENVHTVGRLDFQDVSVSGPGMPVRKGGIHLFVAHDLNLNLPGAVVEIASIKAGVQDMSVEISGKASNILRSPGIDLRVRTAEPIDLKKLLAEVPKEVSPELSKLSLQGAFDMDLTARGEVVAGSVPTVDGTMHVRGLSASVQGVPARLENFGMAIHLLGTTTVEIDSTSWTLNGDKGHLLLAIDSLPVGGDSLRVPVLRNLDAQGSVDLAAFAQVASPLAPVLDTLSPSGTVVWKVAAKGRLDPANPTGLAVSGDVGFKGVEASLPGAADRMKVNGSFGLDNTSAKLDLAVVSGPTDLDVKGRVVDWLVLALPKLASARVAKADLKVKSTLIDLDRLLPPPDTSSTPAASSKPLELPKLPPISLQATFDASTIKLMGLSITGIRSRTDLQGGKLVETMDGSVAKGRIRQDLTASLGDPSNLSAKFSTNLTGVQMHDLLVAVKPRLPKGLITQMADKIFGTGNVAVTGSVDGPPSRIESLLRADLSMDLKDGKLVDVPLFTRLGQGMKKVWSGAPSLEVLEFASMVLTAQLRDERIEIKDMTMDGADIGLIQVKGFIAKDQSLDLKVDTHMPEAAGGALQGGAGVVVSASGPVASALGIDPGQALPQDDQGRVILAWTVTGTFNDPKVRPDAKALTDGAKSAAKAALDAAKAKAEAEAKRVKDEAEAEARRIKAEAEAKAKAEIESRKNEATNKAKDAVKGRLKGFGL